MTTGNVYPLNGDGPDPHASGDPVLGAYREAIDEIDGCLLDAIAARLEITDMVGAHKADNDLPPVDKDREDEQYQRLRIMAAERGISPDMATGIWQVMIAEVVERHKALREAKDPGITEQS